MAQANKDIVRTLQKNSFWIATGLMVVVSLAIWWLSTARLRSETKARIDAIKSMEGAVRTVANTPHHPNQHTQRHMEEVISRLSEDVYDAWQQQYDRQRALLTWPQILGQEFIAIVTRLQPIEAKVKFGPDVKEELNLTLRQRYRDYIDTELPKLADIIGAHWAASTPAGRRAAGPLKPPVVHWSPSDQQALQRLRFNWGGRAPTTLEVLYAQEDYWVLRSIMEIIKATNGDVEHRYQAAVKTIDFIDIGRTAISPTAAGATGGFLLGGSSMGGGEADAAGGTIGGFPMSGMPGISAGAGGGTAAVGGNEIASGGTLGPTAAAPLTDPGDYRYVDPKLSPLPAQRVRSAFDSTNPEDAFLMVAKRIPVRIRVKVDQRKLPKLLAECGNARMQLEVRQVRINQAPRRGSSLGGGGAFGGGMGSTPPPPGEPTGMAGGGGEDAGVSIPGFGGGAEGFFGGAENEPDAAGGGLAGPGFAGSSAPPFYGPSAPPGTAATGRALSDESPFDVDVELFGVIYIYNPVDREKLGIKLDEVGEGPATQTPPAEANADGGATTSAG
ncbi:MAG: hypothetical protein KatS3mg110_1969 [Pirellulaceae bacterium]|nr:MAG: hypothetical protein KatS3mg110_1969 [Pirellulaceae bacterium]